MTELAESFAAQCTLGEGPVWDAARDGLWFVDIKEQRLRFWRPGTGEARDFSFPETVGAAGLVEDGRLIVALKASLHLFDPDTERLAPFCALDGEPAGNRCNDGKVDPQGRFWIGTMDDAAEKFSGALYCVAGDGSAQRVLSDIGIANGLDWSPDGRAMYFTDSRRGVIWRFDYDPQGPALANRRVFAEIDLKDGEPDGLTVDAQGRVWSARWNGARVVCFEPDGRVSRIIETPSPLATSCAFGGADYSTLFVTSARVALTQKDLRDFPTAGDVYAFALNAKGRASNLFRL